MSIFAPALAELQTSGSSTWGPQSFQGYLRANGLSSAKTADKISVQQLSGLDPALRAAHVMVFRLGASGHGNTQFGLAHAHHIQQFFLLDELHDGPCSTFVPDVPVSDLFPFQLFGSLTETGGVNLAIASGLLGHALGCDQPHPRVAPATGASTYDFDVRPHASSVAWRHVNGQVEIDAVVLGRREQRRILFVIESKHGRPGPLTALPKTKLAYPCSAVASRGVPSDIPIVPVYLRSWHPAENYIRFAVAECAPWKADLAVADLAVVSTRQFQLRLG
jgi:hypothetical protein